MRHDLRCGFHTITARALDGPGGAAAVVQQIRDRVGASPVYISVDIDVLDPAFAPGMLRCVLFLPRRCRRPLCRDLPLSLSSLPSQKGEARVGVNNNMRMSQANIGPATGTAEPGGWSTRELLTVLDALRGLRVVGGDVVEVAPAYDNTGETTALAAAEVARSILDLMVETPVRSLADL